ncbi:MAG: DUF2955 domain-containing protein [Woeseiaceae bacterium]|nr:DUF2955 domain-containing protein [Woeseiaceae bacterium]
MPSDAASAARDGLSIAQLRTLRLALGTALSLWFSQVVGWQMSFVAPVITMFLLALPLPAPKFRSGLLFVLVMTGCMYGGTLLLPTLVNQPAVGVLLLVLALFWSFYYTASGGSAILGTFATLGIALTAAIGSVNIDAVFILANALGFATAVGILFVWIAYAILPDSVAYDALPSGVGPGKKAAEPPDAGEARWSAFRSLLIVFPVAAWFLLSAASTAYLPVMLKVASMGQQTTNEGTRQAAHSLIASTLIGGALAIIGWNVLTIAPTLPVYTLFIALAGLFVGPRVFKGLGMQPNGAMWSYAYLTMIVILAPAVMDSASGAPAGAKFWDRLLMFGGTALYALVAVYIVDAFRRK